MDVQQLFALDESGLELIVRTSVLYLGLIAAFRLVGRREASSLELPELLLVVLIADGVQNGLSGDYHSVTGAIFVAATLFFWSYALDALIYNSSVARRLLVPAPLDLVRDGRINRRSLRRELISVDELMSLLREHRIDRVEEVAVAYLESNGELSVRRRATASAS